MKLELIKATRAYNLDISDYNFAIIFNADFCGGVRFSRFFY